MSTTCWAVKLGEDRWYDFTYDYFRGPGQRGPGSRTEDADQAGIIAETFAAKLVKVTRYTATESRQRAEARGEVRALEAVDSLGVEAVPVLLADARKRAGL